MTGVTISSDAIAEAVTELLAQAAAGEAVEAEAPSEEAPAEEAPAEEAPADEPTKVGALTDGTSTVDKDTPFSVIHVTMNVEGGVVASAEIASEGDNDLLTDDSRKAFADQIVEKQAVDAVTGVTISSDAIAEAVNELLAQATGK